MNVEVIAKTVQFAAKAALLACCSTALARQLPARATSIPNGVELVSGPSRLACRCSKIASSAYTCCSILLRRRARWCDASFLVYDDDGQTYKYENGDYLRQQIEVRSNNGATTLTIAPGNGNYASPLRTYLLRIHAVARKVTVDGRPLPRRPEADG